MRPSGNSLLVQAFASELKRRRLELGLTQEDLAASTSLDRPFLTLIESAKKQPSLSVYWKIAAGLRWSAAEMATRVDQRMKSMEAGNPDGDAPER
jgi:transcriptional regulator with XRE-family HTH domain